ncbi:MAG: glycosyltransferase family 4 protein [Cyclobacteriaceae bacterium]
MKRIGIYSGHIPSTPFIEHLINGLAKRGNFQIEIYGVVYNQPKYAYPITIRSIPRSYKARIWFAGWYFIFLLATRGKQTIRLIRHFLSNYKGFHSFIHDACLAMVIMRNPPDVFHVQWAKSLVNLSWLFELNLCKVVLSLRGAHINYSPIIDPKLATDYNNLFPKVDGFHAVSKALVKKAYQYGASSKKTEVIYSIVPDGTFTLKGPGRINDGPLNILSVGRFHWKKGYNYSLDAMAILKNRGIKFHYTLIASGATEDILYQIHDCMLDSEVKIINGLEHQEVLMKMLEYDLLLLPSLEEGIANVVLEAMALGLPVITTNCGGMEEIVKHKVNGWVVPARNQWAIADAIQDFIETPRGEKEAIGKEAHEWVRELCSENKQIEKFERLYMRVLDAKN